MKFIGQRLSKINKIVHVLKDVTHLSPCVTMNVITETQHVLLFQSHFAKKTALMTPDFFFDFSFYYPVRNFILKYEYSSSPIYKSYTSFSVGRWLRFLDVLAYRSSVQSIITSKHLILTSNFCCVRKEILFCYHLRP